MPHVANVTVNSSQVTSDHTDFVVYVGLSDLPTTEFWGTVANGGGGIRCYKSDGTTQLAREVVSCDTATDTGELHVRYDGTLSSSVDTVIQIWTDEGTEPAVTATYGRNAVWADYEIVIHAESTSFTDSTGNGNNGTNFGASIVSSNNPIEGNWGDYDGTDQTTLPRVSALENTSLTLQAWGRIHSWDGFNRAITSSQESGDALGTFRFGYNNSSGIVLVLTDDTSGKIVSVGGSLNTNYLLHITSNGTTLEGYSNGVSQGTASFDGDGHLGNDNIFRLGQWFADDNRRRLDGNVGEFRGRASVLSSDWIADEYTNQDTPTTFYTASAAGGTPVTVTLSNASETDTALPVAVSPIIELDFGFAAETDTAEAITISANVNVALGVASETDTALPTTIAPTQLVTFIAATEADSALPVTVIVDVTVPIGVASEADTALPMEFLTTIFLSLGVADEVDNALRVAINAGGSFSRGALNDAMIQYFNQRGYNGALSGQMIEWLQANGAVSANLPDAWMEMLNAKITAPVESWNDAWFYLLGVNGFTQGTLPDRQLAFFLSNANLLGE